MAGLLGIAWLPRSLQEVLFFYVKAI